MEKIKIMTMKYKAILIQLANLGLPVVAVLTK
jgi:hypothetical protein